jgi:hypothetical protein
MIPPSYLQLPQPRVELHALGPIGKGIVDEASRLQTGVQERCDFDPTSNIKHDDNGEVEWNKREETVGIVLWAGHDLHDTAHAVTQVTHSAFPPSHSPTSLTHSLTHSPAC